MQKGWGLGCDWGLENWGEGGVGWGGQGSEVITAAFLDKGATSPFLLLAPDGCWCSELLWCNSVDLDTTLWPLATKLLWPFGSHLVKASSAAYRGGRRSTVAQTLTASRPPPICLPPLHAWPFYRICSNRDGRGHPQWLPLTPHGVHF